MLLVLESPWYMAGRVAVQSRQRGVNRCDCHSGLEEDTRIDSLPPYLNPTAPALYGQPRTICPYFQPALRYTGLAYKMVY